MIIGAADRGEIDLPGHTPNIRPADSLFIEALRNNNLALLPSPPSGDCMPSKW